MALVILIGSLALALYKIYDWSLGNFYGVTLATKDKSDPLGLPSLAYLGNEISAWKALSPQFTPVRGEPGPINPQDTENLANFVETLKNQPVTSYDAMLAYFGVHGAVRGGQPVLLASTDDPILPGGAYKGVPFATVVEGLSTIKSRTAVLFLDLGPYDYAPQDGQIANRFLDEALQVVEKVKKTAPSNAWVFFSHSPHQQNHWFTRERRRSVFGFYVVEGLSGRADANGDKAVTLGELESFVDYHVSQYVKSYSGGFVDQSPRLVWLGEGQLGDSERERIMSKAFLMRGVGQAGLDGSAAPVVPTNPPATTAAPTAAPPAPTPKPAATTARLLESGSLEASGLAGSASDSESDGPGIPPTAFGPPRRGLFDLAFGAAAMGLLQPPAAPAGAAPTTTPGPPPPPPDLPKLAAPKPPEWSALPTDDAFPAWVQYGWKLRDLVDERKTPWSPLDEAPHLWREYQELLVQYDQLSESVPEQIDKPLREAWQADVRRIQRLLLDQLPTGGGQDEAASRTLGVRFEKARVRPFGAGDLWRNEELQAWPLGAAERLAPFKPALARELLELRTQLEYFLPREQISATLPAAAEKPVELFKRLMLTASQQGDFAVGPTLGRPEMRLAELIGTSVKDKGEPAVNAGNFDLIQHALSVRLYGERLAAAAGRFPLGLYREIEQVDRERGLAEKELLSLDWRNPGAREPIRRNWLEIRRRYGQVEEKQKSWQEAVRLRNKVWFSTPEWQRWFALRRGKTDNAPNGINPPKFTELKSTLERLSDLDTKLDEALDREAALNVDEFVDAKKALEKAYAELEDTLKREVVELLLEKSAISAPWRLELLLQTALPRAEQRPKLWAKLRQIAPEPKFHPNDQWRKPLPDAPLPSPIKELQAGMLQHYRERAELQYAWLALVGGRAAVEWEELTRREDALKSADSAGFGPAMGAYEEGLKTTYGLLRSTLEQFPDRLAAYKTADVRTRRRRQKEWSAAEAAARTLDAHRVNQLADPALLALQEVDGWYDWTVWQQERAVAARDFGPFDEQRGCQATAEGFNRTAGFFKTEFKEPAPPAIPQRAELAARAVPETVALTEEKPQEDVRWELQNTSSVDANCWLMLTYDRNLLDLELPQGSKLITPEAAEQLPRNVSLPDDLSVPLARNQAKEFDVRVKAVAPSRSAARIELQLVDKNRNPLGPPKYVPVTLPKPIPFELVVNGGEASGLWSVEGDQTQLFPFPNTRTNYTLALRNRTGEAAKVKVEVFATPVDETQQAEWPFDAKGKRKPAFVSNSKVPLLSSIESLDLDADPEKTVSLKFAPYEAGDRPKKEGEEESKMLAGKPVPAGMIVVVTRLGEAGPEGPEKQLLWAPTLARLPSTYLDAAARTEPARTGETKPNVVVTVKLKPGAAGQLPNGLSRVRVRFPEGQAPDSEVSAELRTEPGVEPVAELRFPAADRQESNFWLDVDGFPRAFQFTLTALRVAGGEVLPKVTPRVLVTNPPAKTKLLDATKPEALNLPMDVEFDVAAELLVQQDPRRPAVRKARPFVVTYWQEVGGEFRKEERRFFSPRDVEMQVVGMTEEGGLILQTQVRDHRRNISLRGMKNTVVRTHADLHLTGGPTPDQRSSTAVVLDASPPTFPSFGSSLPDLEQGKTLRFALEAVDAIFEAERGLGGGGLGGRTTGPVASVVADWNPKNLDKFADDAQTVRGEPSADGLRWTFSFPTDDKKPENSYSLLVRATDRVGLETYKKLNVKLFAPKKEPGEGKPRTHTKLAGTLTFFGDKLSNPATVRIRELNRTARTTGGGAFDFPQVPPGNYTIEVTASEQNKTYSGLFPANVFVPTPPPEVTPASADLKDLVKPQFPPPPGAPPGFPP